MNLSDHSESIHKKIKEIQKKLHDLKEEEGWNLESWLRNLGLTGWLQTLVKYIILFLTIILGIVMIVPCLISCLQQFIQKSINSMWQSTFVAQKESGGSVENAVKEWLANKGHSRANLMELQDI